MTLGEIDYPITCFFILFKINAITVINALCLCYSAPAVIKYCYSPLLCESFKLNCFIIKTR
ncbi:hypothetical protein SM12VA4_07190 [Serratia marcescens]|nr:hypothetical protein SM12VA4_07190 [Serratia marcescens]BEM47182.1 hypothetical protein SME17J_06760 [Serratia marcescens]BEO50745.1 hypothetical protein SMQE21_06850 [Serratia marcescens]